MELENLLDEAEKAREWYIVPFSDAYHSRFTESYFQTKVGSDRFILVGKTRGTAFGYHFVLLTENSSLTETTNQIFLDITYDEVRKSHYERISKLYGRLEKAITKTKILLEDE